MRIKLSHFFWLVPLVLFLLQALFTLTNSLEQIRVEEIRASIRDVFWWHNKQISASNNSLVGWYTSLNILYSIFGFEINMGKYYRLGLSLISLICLAIVLKKVLGQKLALIPLFVIGCSPMLLFFNTLNLPIGIDLQYLPIILYLFLSTSSGWLGFIKGFLGWMLTMFAWLSYPTFVFYLPILFILYIWNLKQNKRVLMTRHLMGAIFAFLLPLILVLLWVKDPINMLYDSSIERGLFTAGGGIILSGDNFIKTLAASFENLFIRATSYYLELSVIEFSHLLPFVSFIFVLWASFLLYQKQTSLRMIIGLVFFTMLFNIFVVGFTIDGGIPGGRRNTPSLSSFYVLFALVWWALNNKKLVVPFSKTISKALLLIILIHHIVAYPINLIHLKDASPFNDSTWFSSDAIKNLDNMFSSLQHQDLYLNCQEFYQRGVYPCGYINIYSVLAGRCIWDKKTCHDIYGFIPDQGYQSLDISRWEESDVDTE